MLWTSNPSLLSFTCKVFFFREREDQLSLKPISDRSTSTFFNEFRNKSSFLCRIARWSFILPFGNQHRSTKRTPYLKLGPIQWTWKRPNLSYSRQRSLSDLLDSVVVSGKKDIHSIDLLAPYSFVPIFPWKPRKGKTQSIDYKELPLIPESAKLEWIECFQVTLGKKRLGWSCWSIRISRRGYRHMRVLKRNFLFPGKSHFGHRGCFSPIANDRLDWLNASTGNLSRDWGLTAELG